MKKKYNFLLVNQLFVLGLDTRLKVCTSYQNIFFFFVPLKLFLKMYLFERERERERKKKKERKKERASGEREKEMERGSQADLGVIPRP